MSIIKRHYGSYSKAVTIEEYDEIGARYNLKNICTLDINNNVMPTYKAIYFIIRHAKKGITIHRTIPTRLLELSQRLRQVLYMVVGYQKV